MTKKMAIMDWRAMKYYHVRAIILPIVAVAVGLFTTSLLVMPTCILSALFFSLNPFAVEEKGALNNLYLTLPVSRNAIVSGRFLLAGIMGLCAAAISIPLSILVNTIGWSHFYIPVSGHVFILAVSYFLFAFMNLASYPILFKLGYSKGKFWGLAIPAVLMGLLYGVVTMLSYMHDGGVPLLTIIEFASENILWLGGGLVLLGTLFIVISLQLSRRIYARRDF